MSTGTKLKYTHPALPVVIKPGVSPSDIILDKLFNAFLSSYRTTIINFAEMHQQSISFEGFRDHLKRFVTISDEEFKSVLGYFRVKKIKIIFLSSALDHQCL